VIVWFFRPTPLLSTHTHTISIGQQWRQQDANIEWSEVRGIYCLAELIYDLINRQYLCGKCRKPVTIQYLHAAALLGHACGARLLCTEWLLKTQKLGFSYNNIVLFEWVLFIDCIMVIQSMNKQQSFVLFPPNYLFHQFTVHTFKTHTQKYTLYYFHKLFRVKNTRLFLPLQSVFMLPIFKITLLANKSTIKCMDTIKQKNHNQYHLKTKNKRY